MQTGGDEAPMRLDVQRNSMIGHVAWPGRRGFKSAADPVVELLDTAR